MGAWSAVCTAPGGPASRRCRSESAVWPGTLPPACCARFRLIPCTSRLRRLSRVPKIDRGYQRDQALDSIRVEGSVAQAEGAAPGKTPSRLRLSKPRVLAAGVNTVGDIAVDIVVQIEISIGPVRVAPVNQIDRNYLARLTLGSVSGRVADRGYRGG